MNAVITKVEGILKAAYSTENYLAFLQELFDGMQVKSPDVLFNRTGTFASYIEGHRDVGRYTDPDGKKLILLAVQLKKANYVENSRGMQRAYAKRLIENSGADAAVVAFYMEDDSKWRLSFVRLDYEMKIEHGRIKTQENLTPARRYSYLVGQDEPCHTAIERFGRYLDGTVDRPTLDDLEDAFSVEAVTNEFFSQYCDKFMQLRNYLEQSEDFRIEAEAHNFTSEQFAKKLMGQIVFLYFLQKKGWLGVNALPDTMDAAEFKRASFRRGGKSREVLPKVYLLGEDGLYHLQATAVRQLSPEDDLILSESVKGKPWGTGPRNFMRRLFQDCARKGRNFYDDYLEPLFYDALNVNRRNQNFYDATLHCRIPFLSGGLFEPLAGYNWQYNRFNIPNELFSNRRNDGDREADGILDVFDRYNFTMSEDEPLEREVAIDPEMLGKVFENLLDVSERKGKGAFYTPREIVHYMCQESLINYLTRTLNVSETAIRDFILMGDFMSSEDTSPTKRKQNGGMYISEELFVVRDEPDNKVTVLVNRLGEMDDALRNIRVVDPAVGSGAFPLGMLNEIVKARSTITNYICIPMDYAARRSIHIADRSAYRLKLDTIRDSIFAADIEPSAVDIARLRLWLSLVIDDELVDDPVFGHNDPLPLPNLECNIVCGNSLLDELDGIKLVNQSKLLGTEQQGAQIDYLEDSFNVTVRKLIERQQELFSCEDTDKKQQILEQIETLRDAVIRIQLEGANPEIIAHYEETRTAASKPYVLWQLEFARVFREKGGFDVAIGNPPYVQVPKGTVSKVTFPFSEGLDKGKQNLYKLFVEHAYNIVRASGCVTLIVQSSLMCDLSSMHTRQLLLENTTIQKFIEFPKKASDSSGQVFSSVLQGTCICMFNKEIPGEAHYFSISINNNINTITHLSFEKIRQSHIEAIYPESFYIPLIKVGEYAIIEKIRSKSQPLLHYMISISQGDLNLTGAKKEFSADATSVSLLRGRNIGRYYIHNDSGEYVREGYLPDKVMLNRTNTYLVAQEITGTVDEWRLHFALTDSHYDFLFGHTANKILLRDQSLNYFILGVLNSKIEDWLFRKTSTNNHVMGYELTQLPIPVLDKQKIEDISSITKDIVHIATSQGDIREECRRIDLILYQAYGLTEEEIVHISS